MTCFVHSDTHPLYSAEQHLRQQDVLLAQLIDHHGPCLLADESPSHFHVLVKTVLDQQLSVKAAARIGERLLMAQGAGVYHPDRLLGLADETFRDCGVSVQKIRYIRGLALAVNTGTLDFAKMDEMNDEACIDYLVKFLGVGRWTAEIFLMFSCKRFDILPIGDLALRKAFQRHYQVDADAAMIRYREIAEPWRPYRSIASWYLWAAVD